MFWDAKSLAVSVENVKEENSEKPYENEQVVYKDTNILLRLLYFPH